MADPTVEQVVETLGRSSRVSLPNENGDLVRKMEPLSGTLRAEKVRCGKPACRCARGERHGPYLYRRWREDRRQRRQYVKPADAEGMRAALAAWRRLHPPAWQTRQELAALRWLLRHLDALEE